MTWSISQFIVNLFQAFVLYKTIDLYYEQRFKFKYLLELVIAGTAVLLSLINYNYAIGTNPLLYFILYFFLVGLTIFLFKGNPISKIFIIFFVIALFGLSELVSAALIYFITGIDFSTMNEKSFGRLLAIITSQTLIMFTYLILRKRVNREKMNYKNNMYYLLVGSIMFMTVMIIVTVLWMYGNLPADDEFLGAYIVYLTLGVSLISIFSIALTSKILTDMEEKHKLDLELQHIKLEHKYFSDVNNALEEIRILRHDMRGELAIIHGYNELNQRDKIRSHIEKKLKEMDVKLIPKLDNDNIITSFLNFKIKEAQSFNIETVIQSNLSDEIEIYIDKDDICRILNNVLSNAVEACRKCDDKFIKLQINSIDNYIVIKCENSFSGIVMNEGGILVTIKKDKSKHGYGLKSINNIANKYEGSLDINYNDNVFCIEIILLNKKYSFAL